MPAFVTAWLISIQDELFHYVGLRDILEHIFSIPRKTFLPPVYKTVDSNELIIYTGNVQFITIMSV